MGVDCSLKVGKEYTYLDRWYVFSDIFVSGKPMTKSDALAIIQVLLKNKRMSQETERYGDGKEEAMHRYKHWLKLAKKKIKAANQDETIVFYDENDSPKYDEDFRELLGATRRKT